MKQEPKTVDVRASSRDESQTLAAWLVESARRRWPEPAPGVDAAAVLAGRSADQARAAQQRRTLRHTALLIGLSVAYIQYYFWDVNLAIARLPATVVFVSPAKAPASGQRGVSFVTRAVERPRHAAIRT